MCRHPRGENNEEMSENTGQHLPPPLLDLLRLHTPHRRASWKIPEGNLWDWFHKEPGQTFSWLGSTTNTPCETLGPQSASHLKAATAPLG